MLPRLPAAWILAAFLLLPGLLRAQENLHEFDVVAMQPGKSSIFIGTVTLTTSPFQRKDGVFSARYTASVFPYFFLGENGTIDIAIPDDQLRKAAQGLAIDFRGRGKSDDGEGRRVEGHAEPLDSSHGKIRVRIYVSKRISLSFDTVYQLPKAGAP